MESIGRKLNPVLVRRYLRLIEAAQSVPVCTSSNDFLHGHSRKTLLRVRPTDNLPNLSSCNSMLSHCIRPLFTSISQCFGNEDTEDRNESKLNDMLRNDAELQNIMKDIMHDFSDGSPPNQPPKTKKCMEEHESSDTVNSKLCDSCGSAHKDIPRSIEGAFKVFDDSQTQEILDYDEEQQQKNFYLYQEKSDTLKNYELKRGKEGVFDIEELVTVLHQENAGDVVVISVPDHLHYCKYLVVATAKSPRHLKALNEFLKKLHKKMKSISDPFIITEGKDCKDWKVLDMGNIVLHTFLEDARKKYDLETLWTVGEQFDDLSNQQEDPVLDLLQQHIKYLDDIEPMPIAKEQ